MRESSVRPRPLEPPLGPRPLVRDHRALPRRVVLGGDQVADEHEPRVTDTIVADQWITAQRG